MRGLERSERFSLLQPAKDRTQQILRLFHNSFETNSYDETHPETGGAAKNSAPKVVKPQSVSLIHTTKVVKVALQSYITF